MTNLGHSPAPLEPPARRKAVVGRDMVERVLMNLWTLPPRVKREPLSAALTDALKKLEQLSESDLAHTEHVAHLEAALSCMLNTAQLIRATDADPFSDRLARPLEEIAAALREARIETLERLVSVQSLLLKQFAPKVPPPLTISPFRLSIGLPVLHTLDREPLPLGIRVEAPEDAQHDDKPDDSGDENETEAALEERIKKLRENESSERLGDDPGTLHSPSMLEKQLYARPDPRAPSLAEEMQGIRRIARDCMEEMGAMGILRSPDGNSIPWAQGPEQFEQRLLNSLDALVSLGYPFVSISGSGRFDILSALIDYAGDGFLPDPSRAFASAFMLGCVSGEDTALAAAMRLRQSHRMTYNAQRDALALAPNPHIGPAIRKICNEGNAPLMRTALDILRMRLESSLNIVAPLIAHPDAAVRGAAAKSLPLVEPREGALALLEQRLPLEDDERVVTIVLEGMLRLGSPKALTQLRLKLAQELASPGTLTTLSKLDSMRLVAIAGDESDTEILARLLDKNPHEANAIGWFGHPAHLPILVQALEQSEGIGSRVAFAREVSRALHRISGLGTPEGPSLGSLQAIEPPIDSRFWKARLEKAGEQFEKPERFRFGKPFTPFAVLAEAQAKDVFRDRRVHCELELSILSQGTSRFFVHDWVARQETALMALRDYFSQGKGIGVETGKWVAPRLGKPLN